MSRSEVLFANTLDRALHGHVVYDEENPERVVSRQMRTVTLEWYDEKAIGRESLSNRHILSVERLSKIPFDGYRGERDVFKITVGHPKLVRILGNAFDKGEVGPYGKLVTYEADVRFTERFMIDSKV